MTGFETRTHCVCFTGHRPEKLSFNEAEVKAGLTEQIKKPLRMVTRHSSREWEKGSIFGPQKSSASCGITAAA